MARFPHSRLFRLLSGWIVTGTRAAPPRSRLVRLAAHAAGPQDPPLPSGGAFLFVTIVRLWRTRIHGGAQRQAQGPTATRRERRRSRTSDRHGRARTEYPRGAPRRPG